MKQLVEWNHAIIMLYYKSKTLRTFYHMLHTNHSLFSYTTPNLRFFGHDTIYTSTKYILTEE